MILLVKDNSALLNYSLYLLGVYETPPQNEPFYDTDDRIYPNIISVFVNMFTFGKANHDNLTLHYNIRNRIVAIQIDVKDYMLIPKELREQLEGITKTQLIHLFGSGD